MTDGEITKIALFKGRGIRKILHHGEWWFSVVDVIEALTDSTNPNDYWYRMKTRVKDEEKIELSTICRQLKLEAADGKKYETDCANTEIHRVEDSKGVPKLRSDARAGGDIAGGARKKLEERLGRPVVPKRNYLKKREDKRLK